MSELPKGWELCKLADWLDISTGKLDANAAVDNGDYPFFTCAERVSRIDTFAFDCQAVLLAGNGNFNVHKYEGKFNAYQRTYVLKPNEVDLGFAHLAIKSLIPDITKDNRGSTIKYLRLGDIANTLCSLPPLPEQRRIVRKLDTLSARTSTARTHLTAIAKLVERYKVAVLGQLFGKSGADPKPTEHLWAIPSDWTWKKVKDIGDVGLGRQRSPQNHDGPFMRPYIRSANITWQGVDISDVKEMNFDKADFERFQLVPGDVLLNEGSGSAKEVGKPAIWRGEIPNCCYQNTVLRVQPRECTSEYLYWYFLLTALSEGFVGDTKGVNIQHIGKNGLADFPIPVPPIDEQNEIVRRIEAAFAKIDRLAAEAEKALKLTDRLDQRILAKAFAGELVPQDPTDEPASELLARIRQARATAPKPKRGRRKKAEA